MKESMFGRRNFIGGAAIGMVALSIPQIVSAALAASPIAKISIDQGDVILFQGDSVTDSSRGNRDKSWANDGVSLGIGYAFMVAGELLMLNPGKKLHVYNRAVSGDKVYQLAERWDSDTLALKPNVLSINVGVNDYRHVKMNGYAGTIDTYITDYHKLIERTKTALPNVKLIIGEPFGVLGLNSVTPDWYPTFNLFRKAARDIATAYNASFIPYQAIFDKALTQAPPVYWTTDGVHPSMAGAALMAQAWLEAVK